VKHVISRETGKIPKKHSPVLLTCALEASSGIAQAVPLRLMGPISVFTFVVSVKTMEEFRILTQHDKL
jgi:hypothetical protein